jgi:hypothetical protein
MHAQTYVIRFADLFSAAFASGETLATQKFHRTRRFGRPLAEVVCAVPDKCAGFFSSRAEHFLEPRAAVSEP